MQQLILGLLRAAFRLGGLVAPRFTARRAFELFTTPRFRRPLPPAARRLLDAAETFDVDHDGGRLRAFRWRPAGGAAAGAPAVLLVHGWESRAARLDRWVEPLLEEGFEVVAFDAPAHGESEGRRSSLPDFVAAIAGVAAVAGPFHAVVGHSLGAASSAMAVAGGHLTGLEPVPVRKLVLVAGPDRAYDVFVRFAGLVGLSDRTFAGFLDLIREIGGQPAEAYSVASVLAGSDVATLVVHDRDDEEIPHADAERVAAASPAATLVSTRGLGHHRIVRDEAVIEQAVAFVANGTAARAVA